jgi:hypothetical protein
MQKKDELVGCKVKEPLDTRNQKTNFTLDNEDTLAKVRLHAHEEMLEIFKIVTFVCLRLIPQVFLSKDSFNVVHDI